MPKAAKNLPKPPKTFTDFTARYPKLADAWQLMAEAGAEGPLDERTARLVKLAVAIGAMREGAVHSSVRKALAMGIEREAMEQVVALAAGTLGMPSTVAAFSWVRETVDKP
jgi:4-carboxymuconolactone decarboxylase